MKKNITRWRLSIQDFRFKAAKSKDFIVMKKKEKINAGNVTYTNKRRNLQDQSDNLISNQISPTNISVLNRKCINNKWAEIIHLTEHALITCRFRNSYPYLNGTLYTPQLSII